MEELGRGRLRGARHRLGLPRPGRQVDPGATAPRSRSSEWLPGIAAGTALGCFGLTEPDTGSDAGNLTTRAVRDGDDYVLNGQKIFITNGTWADVALVFARTGGDGPAGRLRVPGAHRLPRLRARREINGKLGLRGQATAELFLDGVRVPAAALLGEEGQGFKIAMSALDKGRISVAAGCVGIVAGLPRGGGRLRHRAAAVRPADRRPSSWCRT